MTRIAFCEDSHQLLANSLFADLMDSRRHLANRLPGLRLNFVSKACAEANRAQQSELVFVESLFGITDRANNLRANVGLAADVVVDFFRQRIVQKTVDREIAPEYILSCIRVRDACRAATVNVSFVG